MNAKKAERERLQKEERGNEIMLTKKQMKWLKMAWKVLFILGFFAAMLLSFSIINVWGNYGKSFAVILITAMGVTLFFQAEYRLVRKPLFLLIEKMKS